VKKGTAYHASWAPDGQRVVFAWQPTPAALTQLYTLDVDSTDPPKLLPGIDTKHANVNPSWSPDGKSIVFSRPGKSVLRTELPQEKGTIEPLGSPYRAM
jgi:Tol biopolymer transport system component